MNQAQEAYSAARPINYVLVPLPDFGKLPEAPLSEVKGSRWHPGIDDYHDPRRAADGRILLASSVDIDAVVLAWQERPEDLHVHFVIYNVSCFGCCDMRAGEDTIGDPKKYELTRYDATSDMDLTNDHVAYGSVKWDGCVNFSWGETRGVMEHKCGLGGFYGLLDSWRLVYHLAGRLISDSQLGDELDPSNVQEL